jgi:hypothetical protein
MWFLNFCTPFDQLYEVNRKIMAGNLILMLLVYLYLRFNAITNDLRKAKASKPKSEDHEEPFLRITRRALGCYKDLQITRKDLDRHFFIFFGQHGVCLIFVIMYSPFWGQCLATYMHTFLGCVLVIFWNREWHKPAYVLMVIMGGINLFLLNSGFYMLAQYSWDLVNVNCYINLNIPNAVHFEN